MEWRIVQEIQRYMYDLLVSCQVERVKVKGRTSESTPLKVTLVLQYELSR